MRKAHTWRNTGQSILSLLPSPKNILETCAPPKPRHLYSCKPLNSASQILPRTTAPEMAPLRGVWRCGSATHAWSGEGGGSQTPLHLAIPGAFPKLRAPISYLQKLWFHWSGICSGLGVSERSPRDSEVQLRLGSTEEAHGQIDP